MEPSDANAYPARPPSVAFHGPEVLGTRLRHLLELLDGDVAAVYTDLGIEGFRPRYAPIVLALTRAGPSSILALARATGVTHSAASQTVNQMAKDGLVVLAPGSADARQRIVRLTPRARRLLPLLEAEWEATTAAAAAFDAELSYPLSRLVDEAIGLLRERPMRSRIALAAPDLLTTDRSSPRTGEMDRNV
ncbi:MAG TPA: helix-turn-helix domain-containing protein [Actinocrinis sp.]